MLLRRTLDESFRPKDIGILSKDAFIARQSNRVMSDASPGRDKFPVECFAFCGDNLVMAKGDGDAYAETFPDYGLREKLSSERSSTWQGVRGN